MPSLLAQIPDQFPYVTRPDDSDLTIHGVKCIFCEGILEELKDHREAHVSKLDSRVFINELSTLSLDGFRWALPSYLNAILSDDPDTDLAEFFVYFFSADTPEKEIDEYNSKVGIFTVGNLEFLENVLSHVGSYLGDIYEDDVAKGIGEIRRLKLSNAEQADGGNRIQVS